jgi:hypothetical protein
MATTTKTTIDWAALLAALVAAAPALLALLAAFETTNTSATEE